MFRPDFPAASRLAELHRATDGPLDRRRLDLLAFGDDARALALAERLARRRFCDARALMLQRAAAGRRTAEAAGELARWRRAALRHWT